ncbi:MAG: hypothetical protein PHW60_01775 [Kiritimatiellae bacterium]|nr:hypothetical protein [Kiritimatiellia bacterium]
MKRILIILLIAFFASQLVCQSAYAQTNAALQATLLNGEITGIKIEKTNIRPWCKGTTNAKGKPEEIKGLEQFVVIQGTKVLILYSEFHSVDEAHRAAEFYSKSMASIFYPGLWDGAQNKSIGDESWYGNDPTGNAILFRSGRICVLVNCYGEDNRAKWSQVAELLAKQIEQKIKKGGRVIVPSEEKH